MAFTARLAMLKNTFLVLMGITIVTAQGPAPTGTCTKVNSCACSYGTDQVVDLTPVAATGGSPAFQDVYDQSYINMFSYNPCNAFTEESCSNVAACQKTPSFSTYPLGTQDSASFVNDPFSNDLNVVYSQTGPDGVLRTMQVTLACIQSGPDSFSGPGEGISGTYAMTLSSVHCCPRKGPPPSGGGDSGGSISVGTVLVIIFLVVVFVYLVGGVLFSIFVQKKSGKQAIPNVGVWTAIPGLVKDGTLFVLRRGKTTEYSKI